MKRSRVYLVGDARNPRVQSAIQDLLPWVKERVDVVGVCGDFEQLDPGDADLIVILGGDGAILATSVRMEGRDIPLIGIRLGHFGFLAELEPSNCRPYLERLFAGEGKLVDRFVLACDLERDGRRAPVGRAVNDAVVTARTPARMLALDLQVDGQDVARYRGDGLIISTPLGSTAHSLAAGGPVVEPGSKSILVTPLAPHTLSSRPLVLDAGRVLTIRVVPRYRRSALLSLDGQRTVKLRSGECLWVQRAADTVRFVSIVERTFFQTLREKFRWGGSVPFPSEDGSSPGPV